MIYGSLCQNERSDGIPQNRQTFGNIASILREQSAIGQKI